MIEIQKKKRRGVVDLRRLWLLANVIGVIVDQAANGRPIRIANKVVYPTIYSGLLTPPDILNSDPYIRTLRKHCYTEKR